MMMMMWLRWNLLELFFLSLSLRTRRRKWSSYGSEKAKLVGKSCLKENYETYNFSQFSVLSACLTYYTHKWMSSNVFSNRENFSLHNTAHIIRAPMPPLSLAPFNFFPPSFQSFSIFHHVISKSHATPFPVNVELDSFSLSELLGFMFSFWNTQKSHTRKLLPVRCVALLVAKNICMCVDFDVITY